MIQGMVFLLGVLTGWGATLFVTRRLRELAEDERALAQGRFQTRVNALTAVGSRPTGGRSWWD